MEPLRLYDELELLRRLKLGDHTAFEMVFLHYKSQMARNALRLLKSPDLAEDLVQELFIKLWEQRSKIDTERTLGSYLYRIASNLAYDYFRKSVREHRVQDSLYEVSKGTYEPIEKSVFDKEAKMALQRAIEKLPQQQRRVFTLCRIEEKSYQEVAELLNISVGTVNNHMTRANTALRTLLAAAEISAPMLVIMMAR
ncbi:RNA polymerase sigma factor [Flavobacterium lindanitolerans]|uniref:RNA polymerase sigma factor n=1 Tax=Flavobacterium lindanitolerans TaxID=428988 RepID=UPI0023F05524|nr:RNA polymerase sigma-70 factor [Flavobacterium lindanitolerans]